MSGYAYASTRVRSREKKLLKKDQIKLLVSAATAETALKQLWDCLLYTSPSPRD